MDRGSMGSLLPLGAWVRNPSLRSWPALLFLLLLTVPPVAIVVFYNNPGQSTFTEATWILAGYFALAWLLLIAVVVRPATISLLLLLAVIAISVATEVPLAIWLEKLLHGGTSNIVTSIFTVGLPEEAAKAIPVVVIAVAVRRRITPADYLFLGAVSGLVFGASEAAHYLTSGAGLGRSAIQDLVAALQYVWRFPTDPITHACLSGITGYFIGLAVYAQRNSGQRKWYAVCWMGLAIATALHGLSDWQTLNGHWAWVAITVLSAILFLTYAKADPPSLPAAVATGRTTPAVQAPATGGTSPAGPRHDIQAELEALKQELTRAEELMRKSDERTHHA
jgi:RsiW-degrading membrane proteinase PrsW (M82 family)